MKASLILIASLFVNQFALAGPPRDSKATLCEPLVAELLNSKPETADKIIPIKQTATAKLNQSFQTSSGTTYFEGHYVRATADNPLVMGKRIYGIRLDMTSAFDKSKTTQEYTVTSPTIIKNEFPVELLKESAPVGVKLFSLTSRRDAKGNPIIDSANVSAAREETVFLPILWRSLKGNIRTFIASIHKPYGPAETRMRTNIEYKQVGINNLSIFELGVNERTEKRDMISIPEDVSGLPRRLYFSQARKNGLGSMVVSVNQMDGSQRVSRMYVGNYTVPETVLGNSGSSLLKFAPKPMTPEIEVRDNVTPLILADVQNGIETHISKIGAKYYVVANKIHFDSINLETHQINKSIIKINEHGHIVDLQLNLLGHNLLSVYPFKNGKGGILVAENKVGQLNRYLLKIDSDTGLVSPDMEPVREIEFRKILERNEMGRPVDVSLMNRAGSHETIMAVEIDLQGKTVESYDILQISGRNSAEGNINRGIITARDESSGAYTYYSINIPQTAAINTSLEIKSAQAITDLLPSYIPVEKTSGKENL